MSRRVLWVLLVAAVAVAGIGTALLLSPSTFGGVTYGWTAYSPLSSTAYVPSSFVWRDRGGAALLAVGAGGAGAIVTALVLRRPDRR